MKTEPMFDPPDEVTVIGDEACALLDKWEKRFKMSQDELVSTILDKYYTDMLPTMLVNIDSSGGDGGVFHIQVADGLYVLHIYLPGIAHDVYLCGKEDLQRITDIYMTTLEEDGVISNPKYISGTIQKRSGYIQ